MEKEQYLQVYRHSLAHILAKSIIEIFGKENVQYAIGPQIADGFYYDFMLPRTLNNDDFKTIEDKMREILKRREAWTRKEISRAEALELFKDQKYKTELIEDLPEDEVISIYWTGDDFVDLCAGPHIDNSQELMNAAFQIKSVSGSYWRGDEHRDQLQRIYVYAFPDKQQLKEHLAFVREAQERDHKKLGPQLDIFMMDETAPGMPYWLPRGFKMFNALLSYWRDIHDEHGYMEIAAPQIQKKELWETSGHWAHYIDGMFIVPEMDENRRFVQLDDPDTTGIYAAKPMNCPNAIKVYASKQRSYKDLPFRISQTDVIHRKEKSGELNGLFRVQMFRQDDAHILLTEDMIEDEINDIMDITNELYSTFGLTYRAELSTRPDDFMGDIEVWNQAEASLKAILDKKYGEGGYEINEGDGAFYGPKIDLMMKDALGREWQMGTIMERFIGILIENFKGSFPFWLSPVQVGIVPIRPEHNEYAKKIAALLRKNHIRFEVDYTDKNMKEKIKACKTFRDPYTIVVGDKEAAEGTVAINIRGNKQLKDVPLDTFLALCQKMNEEHSLEVYDSLDCLN